MNGRKISSAEMNTNGFGAPVSTPGSEVAERNVSHTRSARGGEDQDTAKIPKK